MRDNPAAFVGREWQTEDGLLLHYREYPGGEDGRPTLLCLHGLTRNARDFASLAERHAGKWRVIVPEMRGRGQSEYSRDLTRYDIRQYVLDVIALLLEREEGPVAIIGTSMGGIMAMLIAQAGSWPLAGVALNDIGPVLEPEGLERIREYVGQGGSFETWMHAARALRENAGAAHPDFDLSAWLAYAKRLMCVGGNGRIVFDYDMKIAEPFDAAEDVEDFDLWPAYRALAGKPVLVLRGELSDLLSQATADRMMQEIPGAKAVTIPRVGHPPELDEPEAMEAIDAWLAEVAS